MEAARSVAAFATGNAPGGAAHAVAAGLFAAIAGGAIKTTSRGGGGGRASGQTGTGRGFTQQDADPPGGQQVIVTFGDGVILGTPGQVGKAVAQATGALGGTGMRGTGAF